MKKIVLLSSLMFLMLISRAQICVPGTITAPKNAYILPDSATNFANACPGTYYEQILYIKAAKDTAIAVTSPLTGTILANIDSFVVDANIGGLPSYLSIQSIPAALPPAGAAAPKSNMTRMVIPGDSLACAKISGNVPPGTTAATLPLIVNLRVYTSNLHCNDNAALNALIPIIYAGSKTDTLTAINDYRIVVYPTPCWPTQVLTFQDKAFELIGAVPNPADGITRIEYTTRVSSNMQFRLVNAMGATVLEQSGMVNEGMNQFTLDTRHLASGLYIYSISDGKSTLTNRLQIEH